MILGHFVCLVGHEPVPQYHLKSPIAAQFLPPVVSARLAH